jgi:hypothetical protein
MPEAFPVGTSVGAAVCEIPRYEARRGVAVARKIQADACLESGGFGLGQTGLEPPRDERNSKNGNASALPLQKSGGTGETGDYVAKAVVRQN